MRQSQLLTILDAKAATGAGSAAQVDDYRHLVVEIVGADLPNLTVKCQVSLSDDAPAFASAQSATNMWDYADMVDLQNGASIDGDTGLVFSGSADVRMFEVDLDGVKWINFRVTAWSVGNVTVRVRAFRD